MLPASVRLEVRAPSQGSHSASKWGHVYWWSSFSALFILGGVFSAFTLSHPPVIILLFSF